MAGDAAFWRELEVRFRGLLEYGDSLLANLISTQWTVPGEHWYLRGSPRSGDDVRFKWLAERAAVGLGHPVGDTAVFFWLDLLKRDSPDFSTYGQMTTRNERGDPETAETGRIERVCHASANYCYKLQTESIAETRARASIPPEFRYIAEMIGDVNWPEETVEMRRSVWRMYADEIIPGSFTKRLADYLSNTLLEERTPHWEARAEEQQASTTTGSKRQYQRDAKSIATQKGGDTSQADKGNLAILRRTDGEFKRAVTLEGARRFGGVTRRAIDAAAKKGALKTEGRGRHRVVLVDSLLKYFPPEK